jgi:hypothetical protein
LKWRGAASLLLSSLMLVLSSPLAYAATPAAAPKAATSNNNTLKVSPVRTDISIKPGETGTVTTFITNLTGAAVTLQPIENDFVAGDEKGTPSIILDENSYAPTHSLKRFMVPIKNFTVAAGATQKIDVTVAVPVTAQAGGYFGAIRFAPASIDGSKSVNLSASVASLILLTVPGHVAEQLVMTTFDVQQNGSSGSNFRTPDGISLLMRMQNKGNIQETPFGQIYVKKGSKVLYSSNFNQTDPKDAILPDSARRWEVPLKKLGKFGKYTVGATIGYGAEGQTIEIKKTVWIVPKAYIIAGLVVIAALVALIVGIVLFLKGYKKRVLRKSRRHHRY